MGLADDFDGELDQILAGEEARKKPGFGGQLLEGVNKVVGAPGEFAHGLVRDYVKGATGFPSLPETATPGSMLRAGVGLSQGDEGYGGALLGKGLETAENFATDPLTYAGFGLSGTAAKVATPVFGTLAAVGATQAAGKAYEGWKQDGFTPKVAEDVFDTALQGAMAGAATAHMVEKPLVANRILTETPEVLNKRLERYKAAGKTELYDMVKGEIDKRQAAVDELVNADQAKRDEVINNARQRGGYAMGGEKIAGIVDRMRAGEISPEKADRLLRRLDRENVNTAQEPGELTPEQKALVQKQAELLNGQPNPFAPDGEQIPIEGTTGTEQLPLREPPVDTTVEYQEVPLTDLDVNTAKPQPEMPLGEILAQPGQRTPGTGELGSVEAQLAKVNEDIKIAQTPEQIFSMLDRLEQKAQAPAKPRLTLADVTPPRQIGNTAVSDTPPRQVTITATGETGTIEKQFDRTSERTGGKAPSSYKVTLPDGSTKYVNARGLKFGPEVPRAPERNPIDNQPVGSLGEVQAPAPSLPGGDTGGMVNPEGSAPAGPGLPVSAPVLDNRAGPGLESPQPAGNLRRIEDQYADVKAKTKGYGLEGITQPKKAKPVLDERGRQILPGQEAWSPEQREVVHEAAKAQVADIVRSEKSEPTRRAPIEQTEKGRPKSVVGGEFYGVNSAKTGTALEGLPYTPKDMAAAMKRGGGNPIELDIHRAMMADERVAAELDRLAEAKAVNETEPTGPVDTSFNPAEFEAPKPTKAKTKRGPKPKPVPDTPPAGAEPTHTIGGNPVVILGEVPEGTGLKGETVKVWDPKVKDWSYAKPEDLKPLAKTESAHADPGFEGMASLEEINQERQAIKEDHALGKISTEEKNQRLQRLNDVQEEHRGSMAMVGEAVNKANRNDLVRMEGDERVQTLKQAFQAHVDELAKIAGEQGGYDPMLQQTETTNLRHGQDLAGNTTWSDSWNNTIGLNIPRFVANFIKRMDKAGIPESERALHFQAYLKEYAAHEVAHSVKGTAHTGDVVWDAEKGDWAQTTTGHGKSGPTAPLGEELHFDPETGKSWTNGPERNMQYHTLTEENIRRAAATNPTPYADSLLSEAAKPYVDKVWADAKSAAQELHRLTKEEPLKPIKSNYTKPVTESATAPPGPKKAKAQQTAKQAQNQALKMNATIDSVQKKLKAAGHLTAQQISDLGALIRKDPSKAKAIERIAERPTLWGKINEGWKMGLISGPSTWVVKGVTDMGEMVFRIGETAVAPLVDKLLPGSRTRFESETRARVEGSLSKFPEAIGKFQQDLKDAFTVAPEKIDITRPVELQVGKIEGTKGTFIRTPGRVLNAITDFWRTTEAAGELRRMATQEAEKIGGGATAVKQMAEQIYKEALDPTNPKWEKLLKAANDAAAEQVFQSNNPGPLLNGLMKLRQKNPWLHAVMPFLEVPGNITKMLTQRTPFGAIKAAKAYRAWNEAVKAGAKPEVIADLKGKAVDAITRPLLGTTVMGAFGAYALTGGMTGSGPTDQKLKNEMLQAGWQPYSFKVGKTYIPFHRFEPVGSLLGLAVDMAESRHSKSAEEFFDKGLHSLAENYTNQSYMQSVADAMQFISDPKTAIKTYATSMAGSVVPNIVRRGAQALDPTVRDVKPRGAKLTDLPELMGRSVVAGIPGLSRTLPAKMSDTGEPIKRPGVGVTRFVSPVQPSWENEDTAVLNHMASVDFAPGVPGKSMKVNDVDVEMTEKEYAQVASANRQAIDYIKNNYLNNSRFTGLPAEKQKIYIQRIFSKFRDEAKGKVQSTSSFRDRIREGMANAEKR